MSELVYLVLLILLPILVPAFLIAVVLGKGGWFFKRWKVALMLYESKGLAQQGLLWLSIISPMCYFLALGAISWQEYEISISHAGIDKFVKVSAIPLAILALILPLSVLVSRFHATKQTAEQIRLARQKNNNDLFYAHRKELFSYFSQIGKLKYLDCFDVEYKIHPRLHKIFFLGSSDDGTPTINEFAFTEIECEIVNARLYLDQILKDKDPDRTFSVYVMDFSSSIYRLGLKLGLPEVVDVLAKKGVLVPLDEPIDGKNELLTAGCTTSDAIAAYRYARNYFANLCDFAGRKIKLNDDSSLDYIDEGKKFSSIHSHLVIERIHELIKSKYFAGKLTPYPQPTKPI